jgi:hypothetical protein
MEKILERETNQEGKGKRAKKRVEQKKTNCWKNVIRFKDETRPKYEIMPNGWHIVPN